MNLQKLSLVLLLGASASFSALAQDRPAVGKSATLAAQETANLSAYWTADRLSHAKPMDLLKVERPSTPSAPTEAITLGAQGAVEGKRPEVDLPADFTGPRIGAPETEAKVDELQQAFTYVYPYTTFYNAAYGSYPSKTVGRLFFTLEGSDFSCSASVIRPHTLVTARHCTFDYATGVFGSNWAFYPDLNNGKADKAIGGGVWFAGYAVTWVSGAPGFNFDIAFLALHDADGQGCNGDSGTQPIEHYTGFLGYTYNGNYAQRQWTVLGYPAELNTDDNNPFNGNWEIRTEAATGNVNDNLGGNFTNTIEIGSDQTGGTSGGPWIIGFNPGGPKNFKFGSNNTFVANSSNDGNYANSVNSFKFTNPEHGLAINGPEFDDYNFLNLLTAYNGITCQ
jgi:V8-like Glu-specific endopeptidase